MNIVVLYSLPTRRALATPFKATDEDTKDSAEEVAAALTTKGARVVLVPVSEDTIETIEGVSADCIFNLIEWDGLDTPLFLKALGLVEARGIPFTGPGLTTMTKLTDKVKMKEALDIAGIPTPRWQLFTNGSEPVRGGFIYPVIMKLAWEHCSVGLTRNAIIDRPEELPPNVMEHIGTFHQSVYVEEFIEGREFQVTVLEENGVPAVLPAAEIVFVKPGKDSFLTFESRWDEEHPDYHLSRVKKADVSATLKTRLEEISLAAHHTLEFRDYSRMDIRVRGENPFILEANANPGLGDDEDYGMTVSYKAAGMTFADFIWKIVKSCLHRSTSVR
ncbi:hypothetical protein HY339_00790 [Candidatus Gottesmanbacteria bacterium]|nr:hypothetical protein [Candidatus Gottesmanbacteria bacterium]